MSTSDSRRKRTKYLMFDNHHANVDWRIDGRNNLNISRGNQLLDTIYTGQSSSMSEEPLSVVEEITLPTIQPPMKASGFSFSFWI
jgi:hypothetical protein